MHLNSCKILDITKRDILQHNFPLLRREYLSSAVNVLTNSRKILHITKIDFFQLKFLHSDQ